MQLQIAGWQNFRPILFYQCFQRQGSDQKATINNQTFKLLSWCIKGGET